jgi:DNA polymerase IV
MMHAGVATEAKSLLQKLTESGGKASFIFRETERRNYLSAWRQISSIKAVAVGASGLNPRLSTWPSMKRSDDEAATTDSGQMAGSRSSFTASLILDAGIVRKIIHVDMDAFYASVEQRDDPQLRGRPVIVAWKGSRSVVCAASYEARAFGVRSAMPAVRAERLCPTAVFIAPDFARYRTVSKSVREIFRRHTDLIEPLSLDEAYLDVTQNKTGLPTATVVARMIREHIYEELSLTASAGVAPNKFLAKLASDWKKPDGLFVIQPQEVDAFLLPLPVGRLPGVGKVTEEKLTRLGIKTVGELKNLERAKLEDEFGRYGGRLYELARGIDENPVVPDRPTKSISVEDTFPADVLLAETEPMIRQLAEKLWSASRKESRAPRTVVLKLKTKEFKVLTRSHTPDHVLSSCDELTNIVLKLRDRVDLGVQQRYRLVGVGLSNFREAEKTTGQPTLFE